jgi:hypothetical protein
MTDRLAEDWVRLWQSELTAMAADRELRESWIALVTLWGSSAQAALGLLRHEPPRRAAGPAQPPGPAPAAVAPVPGLDEIERLNRRIAELEQRLALVKPPKRSRT